jgi:hypothetical protein
MKPWTGNAATLRAVREAQRACRQSKDGQMSRTDDAELFRSAVGITALEAERDALREALLNCLPLVEFHAEYSDSKRIEMIAVIHRLTTNPVPDKPST